MKEIYGIHLLIDGYVVDEDKLEPNNICDLFDKLVKTLKMQYLQKPTIMRVPIDEYKLKTDDDEGGWSGICQITTSHMSIHTWPLRKAFMMDVFSCKEFNIKEAKRVVNSVLDTIEEKCNYQYILRRDPMCLK